MECEGGRNWEWWLLNVEADGLKVNNWVILSLFYLGEEGEAEVWEMDELQWRALSTTVEEDQMGILPETWNDDI